MKEKIRDIIWRIVYFITYAIAYAYAISPIILLIIAVILGVDAVFQGYTAKGGVILFVAGMDFSYILFSKIRENRAKAKEKKQID